MVKFYQFKFSARPDCTVLSLVIPSSIPFYLHITLTESFVVKAVAKESAILASFNKKFVFYNFSVIFTFLKKTFCLEN